jgi:hypothetical protein
MQWLRLYSEARTDNKLRTLTDAQHRVWFNLLCYAGEQPKRGVIQERESFMLAIECASGDEDLLIETLGILHRLRIIEHLEDGAIHFTAWDDRQYDKPSDRPEATAERKRRSREKAEGHAPSSNKEDVSRDVTPGHTTEQIQNRTDTEQSRAETKAPAAPVRVEYSAIFEHWWTNYPKGHGNKKQAYAQFQRLSPQEREDAWAGLSKWLHCDRWQRGMVKAAEIWLRDRWWENDPPGGGVRESPGNGVVRGANAFQAAIEGARRKDAEDEQRRNGEGADAHKYPLLAGSQGREQGRGADGRDVGEGARGRAIDAVHRERP